MPNTHDFTRVPVSTVLRHGLVLALAYFVSGKLGLFLAIPPGFATAVWPASGIALAGLLIVGYRLWPGVLLGSFFINVPILLQVKGYDAWPLAIVIGGLMGGAASLQAVAGAYLIRRFTHFPHSLESIRNIILFSVLGGPVACLVAASLSNLVLYMSGLLVGNYFFSWWTWWIGDTIGVVVFTPLIVIATLRTLHMSRAQRVSAIVPFILIFICVITLFLYVRKSEAERVAHEFHEEARNSANELIGYLNNYSNFIELSGHLWGGGYAVDKKLLRQFWRTYIKQHHKNLSAAYYDIDNNIVREQFIESEIANIPIARVEEYVKATYKTQKSSLYFMEESDVRYLAFTLPVGMETQKRGVLLFLLPLDELLRPVEMTLKARKIGLELRNDKQEKLAGTPGFSREIYEQEVIAIEGTTLFLRLVASNEYIITAQGWNSWLVLALGLLFSGGVGLLLLAANIESAFSVYEKRLAERENALKSKFISNVSHELRTPMHAILSFSRFGIERMDRLSPEEIKEFFIDIQKSGKRLMALINNILDLSKLEAGQEILNISKEQNTETIIHEAVSELRSLLEEKALKVVIVSKDAVPLLACDKGKLTQVFINLLGNAIKFSPKGGTISIELRVANDLPMQEEGIAIAIIDEGVGIPEDELEFVFNSFTQSKTIAPGTKGTGLGLSICREIIKLHRGKIQALQNPKGGTIIRVVLPVE
jgi:signal transduction histidine kinase/integral membrane sensor domain MASE1